MAADSLQSRSAGRTRTDGWVAFFSLLALGLAAGTVREAWQSAQMRKEKARQDAVLALQEALRRGETRVRLDYVPGGLSEVYSLAGEIRDFNRPLDLFWMDLSVEDTGEKDHCFIRIGSWYPEQIPPEKGYACSVAYRETVRSAAEEVAGFTEYEKAVYAHDFLVERCSYDHEGAENDAGGFCSTPYACIMEGSAVCSGYSRAFQVLMDEMGIECGVISGYGLSKKEPVPSPDNRHAWNYVRLGAATFFLDVTWDDPDGWPGEIRRDYCMISAEKMAEDHKTEQF